MNKIVLLIIITAIFAAGGIYFLTKRIDVIPISPLTDAPNILDQENLEGMVTNEINPLSIESLAQGQYPGSDIVIEQTLPSGSNYSRYIASYQSEGLKIFALLTIPNSKKPQSGWPVIIFNHGFIPPMEYKTTERYIAYTDAFSRNGYIVFRSDYRGHGNSEGTATGGYGSNAYTIDILNAISSIKRLKSSFLPEGNLTGNPELIVDPEKIGMWGHSMGGYITLRTMVVNKDIKAGIIWAGVVASYPDLLNNWRRRNPSVSPSATNRGWRQFLVAQYGDPGQNPDFWNSISANAYLSDISGPIQLHHGTADTSVPLAFSEKLDEQLKAAGKLSELYVYQGDDHNIANNFGTAITRSVKFFDTYLK